MTLEEARRAIAEKNGALNAVLTVLEAPLRGSGEALRGVPYVLKDTWDTSGVRTTGGSHRHRDRIPTTDARPYARLKETGAVLLGKSNLCDLAFSNESDNHLIGPARNPLDLTRTAGGSTGGGAAAVASGMAAFDWGTDFGGSIRMPAAFCGVIGLRLSTAAWPVEHDHFPRLHPLFYPWCGMGPITRDLETAREVIAAMGPLRRSISEVSMSSDFVVYAPDREHLGEWPTFAEELGGERARLPPPERVRKIFGTFLTSHFEELIGGGELPFLEGALAVALGLISWGKLDKRVHPSTGALLALVAAGSLLYRDRRRSEDALERLRAEVREVWKSGRWILAPTSTFPAPKHGRAHRNLRLSTFTQLGNLTDATAIAIPYGRFPRSGMPRSLQILGPPGSERALLAFAETFGATAAMHRA